VWRASARSLRRRRRTSRSLTVPYRIPSPGTDFGASKFSSSLRTSTSPAMLKLRVAWQHSFRVIDFYTTATTASPSWCVPVSESPHFTYLTSIQNTPVVETYRNPLIYDLIHRVCYRGSGEPGASTVSIARGIREFYEKFQLPIPDTGLAFVTSIPVEVIAMAAAAVRISHSVCGKRLKAAVS
jgi:hypothetical protein